MVRKIIDKSKRRKYWQLGFLGFLGFLGIPYVISQEWIRAGWILWFAWFILFTPEKSKK